jgi:hypothetical protein
MMQIPYRVGAGRVRGVLVQSYARLLAVAVVMLAISGVAASGSPGGEVNGGAPRALDRVDEAEAMTSALRSADGVWEVLGAEALLEPDGVEQWITPERYQAARLDADLLVTRLADAPMEFTQAAMEAPIIMTLPMPDGTFARFAVEESPVMEAPLAAMFPEIKTYRGRGLDDRAATVRFDWTPQGFHAQVLSPNGSVYIDPLFRGNTELYAVYYKREYRSERPHVPCLTGGDAEDHAHHLRDDHDYGFHEGGPDGAVAGGGSVVLRKYRLACAATGEYTQFHGGTVAAGLAAVTTMVNRVTGIYEVDVAVSLSLVANNHLIIYTNPASDPYSNFDAFAMLSQNQSNLNSVIGSANYDVGHVLSTGGGGVAGLGVVCNNSSKARGVSGLPSPTGDPFHVDYVAHEMGHQFRANHTFNGINGSCSGGNRNGSTAYEPGSASTIMGYAGICGPDNLQSNSDPYFSFISQQEMRSFVTGTGNACATQASTPNNPPTVNAGANYTIPSRTPFTLTATGNDPDGDLLSYTWEQRDLGSAQALSAPDNGFSPIFRSFLGTTDPSRTLPRLQSVLSGVLVPGEKYSTTDRTLRFRVTARDHYPSGGAFATGDMQLTVVAAAGPFQVLTPLAGANWTGIETVTWDPAGTTASPILTSHVNILLSTDGGLTFPDVLVANTPNDGSEVVAFPNVNSSTARIKVEAVNNVFFNISPGNFTLSACSGPADTPLAEAVIVPKSRYLSFQPNNPGIQAAFRVTAVALPAPFGSFDGAEYWVGAPQTYDDNVGGTFVSAPLVCDPVFSDWTGISTVHVYGDAIVPSGAYEVEGAICDAVSPGSFSSPLGLNTGTWGDVDAPFDSGGSQPNFADVSAAVDTFRGLPGAPIKPQVQLQPNVPSPAAAVNFQDISLAVDAFRGLPYPFSGPTACP